MKECQGSIVSAGRGTALLPLWVACLVLPCHAEPVRRPPVPARPATLPATVPASAPADADELLITGSYAEAAEAFRKLAVRATSPAQRARAVVGIAQAWLQVGKYSEALQKLDDVPAGRDRSSAWHVTRAQLLQAVGRYDEAIAAAKRGVEVNAQDSSARRLLGQLYELTGQREQAIGVYRWFEALLQRGYPAKAVVLTDAGIAIHRLATLTRSDEAAARTRYALQELFQPAYERVDQRCWPARLASADLLLSKYNLLQAAEDYQAALKINPHLADAHVGMGVVALDGWKFEDVEKHIASALKANSHSVSAFCLKARLHMTERKYTAAATAAEEALKTNARDMQALALLAAAKRRAGDDAGSRAAVDRAAAVDPRSAVVPHELGMWLSAARQFTEAEEQFKKAIELAPEWPHPRTALGMLHMQTGDEPAARLALDPAWRLDPYDAETKNTLDLLDKLERFTRNETAHFIVKSEDTADAAVRPYLAAYMERIYPEVSGRFGGPPPTKTIVELFPNRQAFAVRITGKPWIHTIGACTGRVIAIDAPHARPGGQAFNWARVLRHEFVHTVTLAATHNRIPHWFTEGLAVYAESGETDARNWEWCRMLAMAVRRDRLFDLDSIDWGFARPRRPDDRTLAYAQSEWMVEYIIEQRGFDVLGRMLKAFADRRRQDDVFEQIVGRPPGKFMVDFRAWAAQQVRKWGLRDDPIPPVAEIEKRLTAARGEAKASLLVSLAEARLDDGEIDKAHSAAGKAVAEAPSDPNAMRVIQRTLYARMMMQQDEAQRAKLLEEAAGWARKLIAAHPDETVPMRILAQSAINAKKSEEAIEHLSRLKQRAPTDPFAWRQLADIHTKAGDDAKALPFLMALAELEMDEVSIPLKVVAILKKENRTGEVAAWCSRAIQIDPYLPDVHNELGQSLMRNERFADAADEFDVLTRLEPGNAAHLSRLAFALHRAGRTGDAITTAKRAVTIDPHCEAASLLSPR